MADLNFVNRTLWTADNLDILRGMNSETIDLIYLDPPFNSNRNYAAPVGLWAVWRLGRHSRQLVSRMAKVCSRTSDHFRLLRPHSIWVSPDTFRLIESQPAIDFTRSGSDSSLLRQAFTASTFSGLYPPANLSAGLSSGL